MAEGRGQTPRRLTYCTNIHPGESWQDVRANLEAHLLPVKAQVSPDAEFPVGLRLSGQAVAELTLDESRRFRGWCEEHGLYILTVNGFPYGQFHGTAVKERVYEPDWRTSERVAYTKRIADHLAQWLTTGVPGSISTVPVAFARGFSDGDWPAVRRNVIDVLQHLLALHERTGVSITLAFEPEPCCVIETTPQAVDFFARLDLPDALSRHAGICFDCCHQAVEFEDPHESLRQLEAAGVRISKSQISSSLRALGPEIGNLKLFDEPTYLHQVVARSADGALERHEDLPRFFASRAGESSGPEEGRVHFHIPIFADHLGPCGTTRFFLEEILPALDPAIPLEVETYSWDVLPADLRMSSLVDSIVRELRWVEQTLCIER